MKTLNLTELGTVVKDLQSMVGWAMQKVVCHNGYVCLCFWSEENHQTKWLLFLNNKAAPLILVSEKLPQSFKNKTKPIGLFIDKNMLGLVLEKLELSKNQGRVINMSFTPAGEIQCRLFPHGQNLIASANKKSVALNKPQEIKAGSGEEFHQEGRPLEKIYQETHDLLFATKTINKSEVNTDGLKQEQIKKLETALNKIKADIDKKQDLQWRQVAEFLQEHRTLEVPNEWVKYIDINQNLVSNIENCFSQAKKLWEKIQKTKQRQEELEAEISKVKAGQLLTIKNPRTNQLGKNKSDIKCRTRPLANGATAYIGKSGTDNLNLLRAAKPFHFWLHIKDIPGAYLLIHRNKDQKIPDSDLRDAVLWALAKSHKKEFRSGDKFEFLIAEVRFVKPIKGDKLGRVTYRNERVIAVQIP